MHIDHHYSSNLKPIKAENTILIVSNCDCGKDSLYTCVMESLPRSLKDFARSYRPKVLKAAREAIDWLLEQDADCYIL